MILKIKNLCIKFIEKFIWKQMGFIAGAMENSETLIPFIWENLSSYWQVLQQGRTHSSLCPLTYVVPRGCLQFVIVVFPDHTHYLLWTQLQ